MATLADLGAEEFEVVPLATGPDSESAVTAPADRWVVLVRGRQVASTVAPGTTLAGDARPPGILLAAADLEQAAAFKSDAFREFSEVAALVLTEPGSVQPGQPAIAGVVAGGTLARAMLRGTTRGGNGRVLPGPPSVPLITRSCGFFEGRVMCATPLSFPRRPTSLPPCPNDRGLPAHFFEW
jgi:hypothetical protein